MGPESITSRQIRQIILERSKCAPVGHIGLALSVVDMITTLYQNVLHISTPDDPARDRFVLSKGHASLALYAALFLKEWITSESLNMYCADNSLLGVYP